MMYIGKSYNNMLECIHFNILSGRGSLAIEIVRLASVYRYGGDTLPDVQSVYADYVRYAELLKRRVNKW